MRVRPKELIIEAFGPFSGKEVIDFSKLSQGLFLVTGDTGAGKTTIFDAITFALYGEASGNNRKSTMLRSDFAKEDAITRVTYTFSYEDTVYKVVRTPQFERAKQRGSGTMKQNADATLYELGKEEQVVETGASAVTEKITEIMGINREQFVNVSMIAQGEFLKLLLAKSSDRANIFRNIFKTQIYENLQKTLKFKAKELYGKRAMKKQALIQYAKGASLENMEDYAKLIQSENVYVLPEFIEDLENTIEKSEEKIKILREEKNKYKKSYETTLEKLAKENEKQKSYKEVEKRLERTKRDMAEAQPKLEKAKGEYELWEEKKKDIASINEKAILIKESLVLYEELDKLSEELSLKEKDVISSKKEVEAWEKNITISEKNIASLEEDIKKHTAKYENLEKEKNEASIAYERMSDGFLRSQAGIMALKLSDGDACPVCGSKSHPNKQPLTDTVCTEEELKNAKKERDRLKSTQEKLSLDIGSLREKLKEELEELQKKRETKSSLVLKEQENLLLQKQIQENISSKKEKLTYKSHKEAAKAYEQCLQEIDKIEKQGQKAKDAVDKYTVAIKTYQELIDKDGELLEKKKKSLTDVAPLEKECDLSQTKIKELEREEKTLELSISCNKTALHNIFREKEEFEVIEEEWKIYDDLSQTANGGGFTKGKFDFESFVQAKYFEQIIELANIRLSKMTGGRFQLVRRREAITKASHTGLEIDVLDNNTGKVRRGETLSGGEAFMASLSMALGMSDVISCSSGGIRLDSMFIDEGFGSLDSNSLEKALSILTELSDTGSRAIGIISHVDLLKERIDNKIVVERGIKGSHIAP